MMAKATGVKDVGNYRFFIFTGSPKTIQLAQSPMCIPGPAADSCHSLKDKKKRYANVMWDPRVCRGVYVAPSRTTLRCDKLSDELPHKKQVVRPHSMMAKGLPSTVITKGTFKYTSRLKSKVGTGISLLSGMDSNRPMTPPPVEGRFHAVCQTDSYSELLEDEVGPGDDRAVQTEEFFDVPITAAKIAPIHLSQVYSQRSAEKETQCLYWEIVDKDQIFRPVSENLATAIIERALTEVMDEFELHCLVKQQLRHKQRVHDEMVRMEITKKNLLKAQEQREMDRENERFRQEHEANVLLTIVHFSSTYLQDFVGSGKVKVAQAQMDMQARDPIKYYFGAWLNEQVIHEIQRRYMSNELTDDIIQRLLTCQEEDNNICRPRPSPLTPVNSAVSIRNRSSLLVKDETEFQGENRDSDVQDSTDYDGLNMLWKPDNGVYKDESLANFDDNSIGTEYSDKNDTD